MSDTVLESDVSEEAKIEGRQAENERLLAFQQKMMTRLRELELSNEEKTSLLRAALLSRGELTPELLELQKAETLRLIREQIEGVIKAPAETQPNVLDSTTVEIAHTILASQAALDKARKVSQEQLHRNKQSSSPASPSKVSMESFLPAFAPSPYPRSLVHSGNKSPARRARQDVLDRGEQEMIDATSSARRGGALYAQSFRKQKYSNATSETLFSRSPSYAASPSSGTLSSTPCPWGIFSVAAPLSALLFRLRLVPPLID